MKVLTDHGRDFSPDEIAWGMARYGVWDGESTIDVDNDLQALAKRHGLDPKDVKLIKFVRDTKNKKVKR
tara:strand:+ start:114 stop:320 length:207 start_codon:yes stop_codon:yes gene_type:complete